MKNMNHYYCHFVWCHCTLLMIPLEIYMKDCHHHRSSVFFLVIVDMLIVCAIRNLRSDDSSCLHFYISFVHLEFPQSAQWLGIVNTVEWTVITRPIRGSIEAEWAPIFCIHGEPRDNFSHWIEISYRLFYFRFGTVLWKIICGNPIPISCASLQYARRCIVLKRNISGFHSKYNITKLLML